MKDSDNDDSSNHSVSSSDSNNDNNTNTISRTLMLVQKPGQLNSKNRPTSAPTITLTSMDSIFGTPHPAGINAITPKGCGEQQQQHEQAQTPNQQHYKLHRLKSSSTCPALQQSPQHHRYKPRNSGGGGPKAPQSFGGEGSAGCGGCCVIEDCESTVSFRIRCRRGQLIAILPILALLSLSAHLNLVHKHHQIVNTLGQEWGLFPAPSSSQTRGGSKSSLSSKTSSKRAAGGITPKIDPLQQQKERRAQQQGGKKGGRGQAGKANRRVRTAAPQILPRNESLQTNATFSACLLIKDDNEILPEWLAYHYHTINLRSLIVAVDPLSVESPSNILQRWRLMTDLDVLEWSDEHYMPEEFLQQGKPPDEYMQRPEDFDASGGMSEEALIEISNHRYRQRVFLAQCMKRHRALGNSWVIHIDTDEYVVASKLLRQMRPDYLPIPPMDQPGSVLTLIQTAVSKTSSLVSYPCISMLRVLFGSVESPPSERNKMVPPGFNATSFESLRWRYHALPHNMTIHGNPKVILDVAAIPPNYFSDVVYSIHRPVPAYCHKNKDLTFTSFRKQPIAVNHYLGSWERYSGRQDKRRSRAVYDAKANQRRGKDDGIRPWLSGFVRALGYNMASKLLGDDYLAPFEIELRGVQNATAISATAVSTKSKRKEPGSDDNSMGHNGDREVVAKASGGNITITKEMYYLSGMTKKEQ